VWLKTIKLTNKEKFVYTIMKIEQFIVFKLCRKLPCFFEIEEIGSKLIINLSELTHVNFGRLVRYDMQHWDEASINAAKEAWQIMYEYDMGG
jgi:hypothetical protein